MPRSIQMTLQRTIFDFATQQWVDQIIEVDSLKFSHRCDELPDLNIHSPLLVYTAPCGNKVAFSEQQAHELGIAP